MPILLLHLLLFAPLFGLLFSTKSQFDGEVISSDLYCVNASDPREGRCFFRNAYIVDDVVWVVRNETTDIPPLLCSAVDAPADVVRPCKVEWHPPQDLTSLLSHRKLQLHSYDSGVVFSRLNPNNMYHVIMEDHMPLFELIRDTPELKDWLLPLTAGTASRLLMFQEGYRDCHPGTEMVHLLYPVVRFIESSPDTTAIFHVKFLVAGSKQSCVHAFHCQRGHFLTPDIGTEFRRFALRRAGLAAEARPARREAAQVTVVRRTATRQFANLDEIIAAVNGVLAAHYGPAARNATAVDFAPLSLREQMLAMLHTDILIMVHGGVYGNTIFLPPNAIVIDIYPYAFHPEQHGYHINGIHLSMPSMHYGQLLLETDDPSTTLVMGGVCYVGPCSGLNTTAPLHKALCLVVDAPRLAQRLRQALLAWGTTEPGPTQPSPEATRAAAAVYAPPPTSAQFRVRCAEFEAAHHPAVRPSCDVRRPCDPPVLQRFLAGGHCSVPAGSGP